MPVKYVRKNNELPKKRRFCIDCYKPLPKESMPARCHKCEEKFVNNAKELERIDAEYRRELIKHARR